MVESPGEPGAQKAFEQARNSTIRKRNDRSMFNSFWPAQHIPVQFRKRRKWKNWLSDLGKGYRQAAGTPTPAFELPLAEVLVFHPAIDAFLTGKGRQDIWLPSGNYEFKCCASIPFFSGG